MDNINYIKDYIGNTISVKKSILASDELSTTIGNVADKIVEVFNRGNKVILAGNGGSAGDAQHIAAEFVSKFLYDRPGLSAIALTTDSSMLTAIGNDYGFEKLFSRQIQAQGKDGDLFIGISTSGDSSNILAAVDMAKSKEIYTVALCGESGVLKSKVDFAICVPSTSTPLIQESHIMIGHIICAIVEKTIFPLED